MRDDQRIVVTGIGVVAPNGIGTDAFWANCAAGVSGIKPITLFDTARFRCHHAGEINEFEPERYLGAKGLRHLDRTTPLVPCGQLTSRIVESPYRPKEIIVYGLNLEASDKQAMEQLGVQYVDQRRTFAKLVTTVKQTALRNGLRVDT